MSIEEEISALSERVGNLSRSLEGLRRSEDEKVAPDAVGKPKMAAGPNLRLVLGSLASLLLLVFGAVASFSPLATPEPRMALALSAVLAAAAVMIVAINATS